MFGSFCVGSALFLTFFLNTEWQLAHMLLTLNVCHIMYVYAEVLEV